MELHACFHGIPTAMRLSESDGALSLWRRFTDQLAIARLPYIATGSDATSFI
jgi:hypothetical protein